MLTKNDMLDADARALALGANHYNDREIVRTTRDKILGDSGEPAPREDVWAALVAALGGLTRDEAMDFLLCVRTYLEDHA